MRILVLLLAIFFSCLQATAQDSKLVNTLLWRVSGKGLTKPSYVYGTIHLTDKRVFQLGDSVYKALEQTEGFAAELDMERIGSQLMNAFFNSEAEKDAAEPQKVKELVSPETWIKYRDQLEKKFNKKADKITVNDLDEIESKLQMDLFKKGDMPTFLDAWLSGQARKQGKWVGGIEDLEDQLEHLDAVESRIQMALFDDDYYRGSLEWFIRVYTKQQLDTIDAYMYRETNGLKDYIMIKRNLKMARRMDSLSAIRSTLFAVGAAHLPGDSGVISLLRGMGFTVTPVLSSRKISGDKYVAKTVDIPWKPVPVKENGYVLQMPGTPGTVDVFESMGIDMHVFFDMSFMKLYMTMGIDLSPERRKVGADSMYNALKNRYALEGEPVKEKEIVVHGMKGKEFEFSTPDGEIKMQVFIPEKMERVVLNMVFAFQSKALRDSDSEKFFQSFVFNNDRPAPVVKEKDWILYEYPEQSFSVEMPVKPRMKKDVVSEEGRISYKWQGMDISSQIFYGMNVWTMKEDMYNSGEDSTYFTDIKSRLRESFEDATVADSSFLSIDGNPAYRLITSGKTEGERSEIQVLTVTRGGIAYYVYSVYSPGDENQRAAEKFLASFKLLSFNYPPWITMSSPDKTFTTTTPFPIKLVGVDDDKYSVTEQFNVYDTLAFVTASVSRTKIPSWVWFSSDTAFLRERANQHASWEDSIANYRIIENPGQSAVEFTVLRPGREVFNKVKLIINGDELYELQGNFLKADLEGKYNRFFDDFAIAVAKPRWNRSEPKMKEFSRAMMEADADSMAAVKYWWDVLEFTGADIPALQKLLLKIYPDFDSSHYGNMNTKLFDKIEELDSTHTTIQYIRDQYALIQPVDEEVKGFVLSYLAGIPEARSYSLLKDVLTKYPHALTSPPYFAYKFYDSLKLTATLFPEVMKLASSKTLWEQITSSTTLMVDSNLLDKKLLRGYEKYFIATAQRELGKGKTEIEEGSYKYAELIRVLGMIGTPDAITQLKRFGKFDAREIKFRTYIALLESNQPADNRTAYTLGTTDEFRHHLYDELKRINKLKLFPAIALSQKELGKSKVYEVSMEDEAEPGLIEYASERTILYKGKQQKFYLYKFSMLDGDNYFLAVAGPYPLDLKNFNSTHDVTGVYWDEEFDASRLDELFKLYLKSWEPTDERADD